MSPLVVELSNELKRCLLLSEEDKHYWLTNAASLPVAMVEGVLRVIQEKNRLIDTYIGTALRHDPEGIQLEKLKTKIKQLRQSALALEEKTETPDADAMLMEQLSKL